MRGAFGSGYRNHLVFEWLAQTFYYPSIKFWKLIHEKHSTMSESNFPRPRRGASANNRDVRRSVVRRTEWWVSNKCFAKRAGHRVDSRRFERFFESKFRQNPRKRFGKHGLTCSWRAVHCRIVSSCCGYEEPALRSLLAPHIREIGWGRGNSPREDSG